LALGEVRSPSLPVMRAGGVFRQALRLGAIVHGLNYGAPLAAVNPRFRLWRVDGLNRLGGL
jgi:hypothetical protein